MSKKRHRDGQCASVTFCIKFGNVLNILAVQIRSNSCRIAHRMLLLVTNNQCVLRVTEMDPFPTQALPTCEYALHACHQQPSCSEVYHDYRRLCPFSDGTCHMKNRSVGQRRTCLHIPCRMQYGHSACGAQLLLIVLWSLYYHLPCDACETERPAHQIYAKNKYLWMLSVAPWNSAGYCKLKSSASIVSVLISVYKHRLSGHTVV